MEDSIEGSVCERVVYRLRDRWVYRLPEREWYKYNEEFWELTDASCFELMDEISMEIKRVEPLYSKAARKKMSTLLFRKIIEENMRHLLYGSPTPLKGLYFHNGVLVEQGCGEFVIIPPEPGFWSFTRGGISLDLSTPLSYQQKAFLLDLLDGDPLRINVLRAVLRLVFTQSPKEQVSLYLWGPGATGKSTLVQLLEHIMGEASCALDVLRINNRFEMKSIQDKSLLTLPDIPSTVNGAQCSILKKIISGDRLTCEIKNGPIYSIEPKAIVVITSNAIWDPQDRTSGFRRRFLYLLTPRVATRRDPDLLDKLKKDASGLVNWALAMPEEQGRIGQHVEELNERGEGYADPAGMSGWIAARVRRCPGNEIPLGAKKVPLPGSLYESYVHYAEVNGIEPIQYYSFGAVLEDGIRSQGYREMTIRRMTKGRVVVGLALDDKGQPPQEQEGTLRGEWKAPVVRGLMETPPWEGFTQDWEAWYVRGLCPGKESPSPSEREGSATRESSLRETEEVEEAYSAGRVSSANDADEGEYVDHVDHVDHVENPIEVESLREELQELMYSVRALEGLGGPSPAPRGVQGGEGRVWGEGGTGWMQLLTREELRETELFLTQYPEIGVMLREKKACTEEDILSLLEWLAPVDPSLAEGIDQCYRAFERSRIRSPLGLPLSLAPSTTMSGLEYPWGAQLEESVTRLRELPLLYKGLVESLNEASAAITRVSYMLFRLFRREGSTYYLRKCRDLFPTSYSAREGYPRLIPTSSTGASSIANLRKDCRRVILRAVNKLVLPKRLLLKEVDMVACHTGIYVGLMGEERAPRTWAAYHSSSFWEYVISQWGDGLPKPLLKGILYSGLNGASLMGREGAIWERVQASCKEGGLLGSNPGDVLQRVLRQPILQELASFQDILGNRESIYLPTRKRPYYGKLEEASLPSGGKRSQYHEGLLTSRALASHELTLLMCLCDNMVHMAYGLPVSLENDGLLLLTRSDRQGVAMGGLEMSLRQASLDLLGVDIPLEYKV